MFKKIKNWTLNHQKLAVILAVLAIGLFFSFWLVKPGIMNAHDIKFHLSRIKGLASSLASGDFKALIHAGLFGYGYANGLFYGNMLLYIPAILMNLGFSVISSYKVLVFLCTIATAFTMYWCAKRITKSTKAGLVASFLYSASAYKICDFIIRGAVGEIGAFIFLPICILGLYYLVYDDSKKWYIFSIGFVALVNCHVISTALAVIVLGIFILANYGRFLDDKKRIKHFIYAVLLGIGLGASYIFPLLEGLMKNSLEVSIAASAAWTRTIPFEQLFLGFPYIAYYIDSFIPSGIGIVFIIISAFRFKIKADKNDKVMKFCDMCLIFAFATLFCATDLFPWRELNFLGFIQFPWRIYILSTIFFTISSTIILCYYFKNFKEKATRRFLIPLFLVTLIPYAFSFLYYGFVSPRGTFYTYDSYNVSNGEYLPVGTDVKAIEARGEVVTSNNKDLIIDFTRKGNKITVNYKNNNLNDTYVEVPLLYYVGYRAVDEDNQSLKLTKGENNIIRVALKDKEGTFTVSYQESAIQKYSYYVSAITLVGLGAYLLFKNKKK